MPDFSKQLSRYIPEKSAPIVSSWINETKCRFTVSRKRKTKLGDYQAPFRGAPHKISVNHDLNPYAFLITTIHEFAHLKTWIEHKHAVKPHGIEWKRNFQELMKPFLKLDIFPTEITVALQSYLTNPAASSCTDLQLYRTLQKFDKNQHQLPVVESLPFGSRFSLEDGRVFQIMEKRRTRFKCEELKTGRIYLFHAFAEVNPCKS